MWRNLYSPVVRVDGVRVPRHRPTNAVVGWPRLHARRRPCPARRCHGDIACGLTQLGLSRQIVHAQSVVLAVLALFFGLDMSRANAATAASFMVLGSFSFVGIGIMAAVLPLSADGPFLWEHPRRTQDRHSGRDETDVRLNRHTVTPAPRRSRATRGPRTDDSQDQDCHHVVGRAARTAEVARTHLAATSPVATRADSPRTGRRTSLDQVGRADGTVTSSNA